MRSSDEFQLFEKYQNLRSQGDASGAESALNAVLELNPHHEQALQAMALHYIQMRRFGLAASMLERQISLNPRDAAAYINLGFCRNVEGKYADAISASTVAIDLDPSASGGYTNRGNAHRALGDLTNALTDYYSSAKLEPGNPHHPYNIALVLYAQENYEDAAVSLRRALSLDPAFIQARSNLGAVLLKCGDLDAALSELNQVINRCSSLAEAWAHRGSVFFELSQLEAALHNYEQAIALSPNMPEALFGRANTFSAMHRYDDAIPAYEALLKLSPRHAEAWCNLGTAVYILRRYGKSIDCFRKAIDIKPRNALAWLNLACVMHALKQFHEAFNSITHALELNPSLAPGWVIKGNVLSDLKRYLEAIESYEEAYRLDESLEYIQSTLIHSRMKVCDWTASENHLKKFLQDLVADKLYAHPFSVLSLVDDPALHRIAAQGYAEKIGHLTKPEIRRKKLPSKKLKIGYFSADFHEHATAYLMAELFEKHSHSDFEIVAFSFGPKDDSLMRRRLKNAFTQFIEIGDYSDSEAAIISNNLGIDIAVDLKGYTGDSRPAIFAHRAAPLQLNFLGYPGTMSLQCIDYLIADRTLIAEGEREHYSESILYLPHCYQPNDRKRKVSTKVFSNLECALPEDSFRFACFNASYKITPDIVNSWANILSRVPRSILWLFADNVYAKSNLIRTFVSKGIDENRIIFAVPMSLEDHLSRIRNADLFLDTFPYNAHTTASDALWSGLPVVTYAGRSFASRVAASLLKAVDLSQLITHSLSDYEELAVCLASQPKRLQAIRAHLRDKRDQFRLFDTDAFARGLEQGYSRIYDRYKRGRSPADIELPTQV
jgi:predicted O-linked N-acetylglucosamine transferase (SPINDLY family)